MPGCEGVAMPELISVTASLIDELRGLRRAQALLDASYAEKEMIEQQVLAAGTVEAGQALRLRSVRADALLDRAGPGEQLKAPAARRERPPPRHRSSGCQALAFVQAMVSNLHALVAYKVVSKQDGSIRPWRFLRDYVGIAGSAMMQAGKALLMRLAGADLSESARQRRLEAYANAGRL